MALSAPSCSSAFWEEFGTRLESIFSKIHIYRAVKNRIYRVWNENRTENGELNSPNAFANWVDIIDFCTYNSKMIVSGDRGKCGTPQFYEF